MENKISVDFNKYKQKWRLRMRYANGTKEHIGYYDTELKAKRIGKELKCKADKILVK